MEARDDIYQNLSRIALEEFPDLVENTLEIEGKPRLFIADDSFLDVWLSVKKEGAYSYHWNRNQVVGEIYRFDNFPDWKARALETFPKHFHRQFEGAVEESDLSDIPEVALREVLEFVKLVLINV